MQELQMVPGEMRPPKELEKRTTQHQGEIVRLLEKIGLGHCRNTKRGPVLKTTGISADVSQE